MSESDVVLVVRNTALSSIQNLEIFQRSAIVRWKDFSTLWHWKMEWDESVGTDEYKLVQALDNLDPSDFLLLRTWGTDAVEVSGCYWNNPFKVKISKIIEYECTATTSSVDRGKGPSETERLQGINVMHNHWCASPSTYDGATLDVIGQLSKNSSYGWTWEDLTRREKNTLIYLLDNVTRASGIWSLLPIPPVGAQYEDDEQEEEDDEDEVTDDEDEDGDEEETDEDDEE